MTINLDLILEHHAIRLRGFEERNSRLLTAYDLIHRIQPFWEYDMDGWGRSLLGPRNGGGCVAGKGQRRGIDLKVCTALRLG